MKRLVYCYVSNGSAPPEVKVKWNPKDESHEPFVKIFADEGFCYLFEMMLRKKVLDEVLIVIESSRSPGHYVMKNNMKILVVPHLSDLEPFLRPDDILWARGGWRSWFALLEKWHSLGRWLLFYRAASNRGAWPFWDIVLDDLREQCDQDTAGRFYYPINKPIHPALFYPTKTGQTFDLMVGSSHIHDKKGQYLILPILLEYRKQFGEDLKCVMPGSLRGGSNTRNIQQLIEKYKLDITMPGMVPRNVLRALYNDSSLYVHLGRSGQNDRGPLEALACGTPIMLMNEQFHDPVIHPANSPVSFHINGENPVLAARQIRALLLTNCDQAFRDKTAEFFSTACGLEEVVYPRFAALFNRLFATPHNQRQVWFDSLLGKDKH